jgi:WD40 repeat protein
LLKKNTVRKNNTPIPRLAEKTKIKAHFEKKLNDAKFSCEYDYLLLAFDDHTLVNYDIKYKEAPYKKKGTEGFVFCIRFSPKGDLLAVGDENGFLILIDRFTLNVISKT